MKFAFHFSHALRTKAITEVLTYIPALVICENNGTALAQCDGAYLAFKRRLTQWAELFFVFYHYGKGKPFDIEWPP